jgi:hypothetical protein
MGPERFRSYRLLVVEYDHLLPQDLYAALPLTKLATANSGCLSTTESSNVSGFYRLPREVRDNIYGHLIRIDEPVSFLEIATLRWQDWGSDRSDGANGKLHATSLRLRPLDRKITIIDAAAEFECLLKLVSTCSVMRQDLLPNLYRSHIFSYRESRHPDEVISSLDVHRSCHAFLLPLLKQFIPKIHIDLLPLYDFPGVSRLTGTFSGFDNLEEVKLDFPHEFAVTPPAYRLWYRPP